MSRQYSFPAGHWNWPIDVCHQHAVRAGDLIFTGGQVDLNSAGELQNPGDLLLQTRHAMAAIEILFKDLGVELSDLVKLVIYYMGDAEDEACLLGLIAEIIGSDCAPVVSLINSPELCYLDMLVEIEGVAMRTPDGHAIARRNLRLDDMPWLPTEFSHVVHAGDVVFCSDLSARGSDGEVAHSDDLVAQTQIMMDRLSRAMQSVGANMSHVVKLNTFYLGNGTAEDWEVSARIRADYFAEPGPAATGIPLPSFPHHGLCSERPPPKGGGFVSRLKPDWSTIRRTAVATQP